MAPKIKPEEESVWPFSGKAGKISTTKRGQFRIMRAQL